MKNISGDHIDSDGLIIDDKKAGAEFIGEENIMNSINSGLNETGNLARGANYVMYKEPRLRKSLSKPETKKSSSSHDLSEVCNFQRNFFK